MVFSVNVSTFDNKSNNKEHKPYNAITLKRQYFLKNSLMLTFCLLTMTHRL